MIHNIISTLLTLHQEIIIGMYVIKLDNFRIRKMISKYQILQITY